MKTPTERSERGNRQPSLSVVVVTYRRRDMLLECLASIEAALRRAAEPNELLVVDNGSEDGVGSVVRERFADVSVIEIERNRGFTPAAAEAFRQARGEWIALLNDDVTVEPDMLRVMLEAARSGGDIGAVAAQLRLADRPGAINSAGIVVDRLGVAADRLLGKPVEASEDEPVEVFGTSGGAALYRKAMVEQTGGFDESFYGYLEDVDLAWRARMLGWRTLYAPGAVAYHHHSATFRHGSSHKYFLVGRNRIRLLAKNATSDHLLRYGLRILLYEFGYVLYVLARRRSLAPLQGRLRGAREWREYRRRGASVRRRVELAPVAGFKAALRRDAVWSDRDPRSRATVAQEAASPPE
jgi:GT2 family glycosyltransferase